MNNEKHPIGITDADTKEPSQEYVESLRRKIEEGLAAKKAEKPKPEGQRTEGPEDWRAEIKRAAPRTQLLQEEEELMLERRGHGRQEPKPMPKPDGKKSIAVATEELPPEEL